MSFSLVPRPFEGRRKGLAYTVCACSNTLRILRGRFTYPCIIVHVATLHVWKNLRLFYGELAVCANGVYQALSPPLKGPGYEAILSLCRGKKVLTAVTSSLGYQPLHKRGRVWKHSYTGLVPAECCECSFYYVVDHNSRG